MATIGDERAERISGPRNPQESRNDKAGRQARNVNPESAIRHPQSL